MNYRLCHISKQNFKLIHFIHFLSFYAVFTGKNPKYINFDILSGKVCQFIYLSINIKTIEKVLKNVNYML